VRAQECEAILRQRREPSSLGTLGARELTPGETTLVVSVRAVVELAQRAVDLAAETGCRHRLSSRHLHEWLPQGSKRLQPQLAG